MYCQLSDSNSAFVYVLHFPVLGVFLAALHASDERFVKANERAKESERERERQRGTKMGTEVGLERVQVSFLATTPPCISQCCRAATLSTWGFPFRSAVHDISQQSARSSAPTYNSTIRLDVMCAEPSLLSLLALLFLETAGNRVQSQNTLSLSGRNAF